ncbi:MAG: NUDIX domain-containing protein [Bacteroidota bacterium]
MEPSLENFPIKTKVLGYIVQKVHSVQKLLIFSHQHYPEAGLQVPGGTVEAGEKLEGALLREIKEESGLTEFGSVIYLGEATFIHDQRQEMHRRHFFQVQYKGEVLEEFIHEVIEGEEDKGLRFHYKWVSLTEIPALAADQDCMVHYIK